MSRLVGVRVASVEVKQQSRKVITFDLKVVNHITNEKRTWRVRGNSFRELFARPPIKHKR